MLKQLKRAFECAKERLFGQPEQDLQNRKYVNLAPTHEADENGVYAEALLEATNDREVYNIAVTGPYGSGKSSVIKSFLRKYPGSFLQISLAAFDPSEGSEDNGSKPSHDIERSILQQFQYSADASDLSLSRFKRIQSPKWHSFLKPSLFVVGAIAVWLIYKNESTLLNGEYLLPLRKEKWFNYITIAVASTFVLRLAYLIYVSSFGLSLKGISLKDIEIAPADSGDSSVLNQHLDEIIYFFQVTDYNLVIFEDLDRFKNHEIFVKLREVNALINANPRVKQHVQFLYALRDDMFSNTERTKFFEFIVPIVPIINHSNSIDMVLKQGKRMNLEKELNPQFLTEVSRYLSDLRLIQNIFNEYAVYMGNLNFSEEMDLNANKLLAILIYKNLLPHDFELLHKQEGVLAEIIRSHDDFIQKETRRIQDKIVLKEDLLKASRIQNERSKAELRSIYAMAIIKKASGPNGLQFMSGSRRISFEKLAEDPDFDTMVIENEISFLNHYGHSTKVESEELQNEVDPQYSYAERLTFIEAKSPEQIDRINSEIRELREDIAGLRLKKFFELAQLNSSAIDECLSSLGDEKEVLRYLILEGHLDDNYYQYTSLFHAELMSPNDHKFLLRIRSFEVPAPDYPIERASVVINAMREGDFGKPFVLNVHLFDHMLKHEEKFGEQLASSFSYIASNFESCTEFFANYYAEGLEVKKLIASLINSWPEFLTVAPAGSNSIAHSARIAAFAEEAQLKRIANPTSQLATVLARDTLDVLNEGVITDLDAFRLLKVNVRDLKRLIGHPSELKSLASEGRYELTNSNIIAVFESDSSATQVSSLPRKNYTTVRASKNEVLKAKIEQNFSHYLAEVLLKLDANTMEEAETILQALQHSEAPKEHLDQFVSRQEELLPTLDGVPEQLKPTLFKHSRIEATWENCFEFMNSPNFDQYVLESFMAEEAPKRGLLKQEIPSGEDFANIRRLIYENTSWDLSDYRSYVEALPRLRRSFPNQFDKHRWEFLISSRAPVFSSHSFAELSDYPDLQLEYLSKNIEDYLEGALEEEIDEKLKIKLLHANISNDQKAALASSLDPKTLEGDTDLAEIVTQIASQPGVSTEEFSFDMRRTILEQSSDVATQIKLMNNYQTHLEDDEIRSLLEVCEAPINKVSQWGPQPKIEKSADNEMFAEWLKQRGIISTFSFTVFDRIQLNTFSKARP